MARPKSAQHELKREAILDMAAQCFALRGYSATSMAEIASACGASKARLYHYYDAKEAILFDLLDRYTQRLLALIGHSEALAQRKKLDERAALHELVRAYPQRLTERNQTALTMMLFGMINWTFTWLRPDGPMSYGDFAEKVVAMLERGLKPSLDCASK